MNEHYYRNHHRKPHEYMINAPNPLSQQRSTPKNETAYIFLYVALAVGGLLLGIMAYGFYRDYKSKHNQRKLDRKKAAALNSSPSKKQRIYPDVKPLNGSGKSRSGGSSTTNLYTTGTTSAGGSVPSMSTITEEVQPPAQDLPYTNLLNNNHNHPHHPNTTTTHQHVNTPREDFARHSRHHNNNRPTCHHVSPPQTSHPDLRREKDQHQTQGNNFDAESSGGFHYFSSDNAPTTAPLTNNSSSANSSTYNETSHPATGRRHLSREESFPYEKYGIPVEEREPRTVRVENMRPVTDFLKLTPSDSFYRLDEEDDIDSSGSSGRGGGGRGPHSSSSHSGSEHEGHDIVEVHEGDEVQDRFTDTATLPFDESKRGDNNLHDYP